ncbi:ABC-type transport auxiliary lipoprotein family protein [Propionivibrio soli]|uniref:ABC-type transport auxiliary lipoprotein family protein n=1 Tax=Propionivibrio soli TaxID=2976531 RepID=UPI0021E83BE7|nr:ABC-type transport auxiliary lipoprotein family protein [Propionivibrio soli]
MIGRSAALVFAGVIAGCVSTGRDVGPSAVYDFGLPVARLVADQPWMTPLALEVRSPAWFDSLNVDYRLAYDDPLKQREYAGSRWAGPPGVLLAQRLRQQLGAVATGGMPTADCLIRIDLQEFSQIFDAPGRSRAVVQTNVSLVDTRRALLAQRSMAVERPSPSPDANGGVRALVEASDELGRQIAQWLSELHQGGKLAKCRMPG